MTPQKNALDALSSVCRTLGWLEVVPPYGDAVSRTAECDKAIKLCGEIRAALQAAQVPVELLKQSLHALNIAVRLRISDAYSQQEKHKMRVPIFEAIAALEQHLKGEG